ncbi:MAG: hypothetical protein N3G22_04270, partial [Candidatus Micrarchaeota archaeon]|nr:hypothetical protein [Candidatus Micrarchaeota archaeon]
MAALVFDPLYHSLLVFISAIIPGFAIGWPILKKSDLSMLEKLLICFFVGMVLGPTLLIVENVFGLKFSLYLVIVNLFLLTAVGIFYGIKEGAFSFKPPQLDFDALVDLEFAKKHAASFFLLLAVLLSFWIRLQPYSPIYSELDPYFYVYGAGQIIRFGEVPPTDDTAWWPELKNTGHRPSVPLKVYIEAQWYALYTKGAEYNNYLLFVTSSWLPPIAAALMAFGAYLLMSSYAGKRFGLLAAFLMAFLPVTIYKMSAGVNEAAPFGMMSIFLVAGLYASALQRKDINLALIGALAFFAAIVGSNYEQLLTLSFGAFVAIYSIDCFIRSKKNEEFLKISAVLSGGFFAGAIVYSAYLAQTISIFDSLIRGPVFIIGGAIILAYALDQLTARGINERRKKTLVIGAVLLALIILVLPNPIGSGIKGQIKSYVGAADFKYPLERTIAEQNLAGSKFESEAGFLALVPSSHIDNSTKDLKLQIRNYFLIGLDKLSVPFTLIGNSGLDLTTSLFNSFLGTRIPFVPKENSLMFFFLVIFVVGSIARYLVKKEDLSHQAPIALLLLLLFLPPLYVGLTKIKYTIFVGMAMVVAAVAALSELQWLFAKIARKLLPHAEEYSRYFFLLIIVVVALLQLFLPSAYSVMILSKSFEMRYQDNPAAMMPKLASICEALRSKGYYDQEICAAGYNESFADSINNQFNSKVCLVSQLSLEELLPSQDPASQIRAAEARAGASFGCNRIADYWVDSMEWISKNLDPSDRVTSWWDYGHWINYFGDRKAVLRNEHASTGMIGRIAHAYI